MTRSLLVSRRRVHAAPGGFAAALAEQTHLGFIRASPEPQLFLVRFVGDTAQALRDKSPSLHTELQFTSPSIGLQALHRHSRVLNGVQDAVPGTAWMPVQPGEDCWAWPRLSVRLFVAGLGGEHEQLLQGGCASSLVPRALPCRGLASAGTTPRAGQGWHGQGPLDPACWLQD